MCQEKLSCNSTQLGDMYISHHVPTRPQGATQHHHTLTRLQQKPQHRGPKPLYESTTYDRAHAAITSVLQATKCNPSLQTHTPTTPSTACAPRTHSCQQQADSSMLSQCTQPSCKVRLLALCCCCCCWRLAAAARACQRLSPTSARSGLYESGSGCGAVMM